MWGWWCGDGMVEECLGFPYGKFVGMIAIGEWLKKTQTIHLLQNWFGANVLVSLNHMEVILDLRRRQKNKRFVTNVFVNLQFISLFLFFLSNEGYQKILASKPPHPKGLV